MATCNDKESDKTMGPETEKAATVGIKLEGESNMERPPIGSMKSTKRTTCRKVSSSNNGSVSGNNSDNSANSVLSIGNNSFGFNFDENEGMMSNSSSPPNTGIELGGKPAVDQATQASKKRSREHADAASAAVEKLGSIANKYKDGPAKRTKNPDADNSATTHPSSSFGSSSITDTFSLSSSDGKGEKRNGGKKLDESKREERNAREKERSFRISRQINELRNLLSSGGVIVPKGTKSSVLTEAANYIRMLQQHQYRSEIDRHQLVQQMQMIGSGALGPQASAAIRHVSAQNGVWSLGNFGGVPPKSAMSYYQGGQSSNLDKNKEISKIQTFDPNAPVQTKVEDHEFRFIFNSCSIGMAIASMGGAFIDCNHLFSQLSNYTKQEVCAMTIFNMTSRQDLQHAFDLISQMISPSSEVCAEAESQKSCVLRGSMKNRNDIGLHVSLVKGNDGIAKCFCVTLIMNPASPFDTAKPVPASSDLIQLSISQPMKDNNPSGNLNGAPAFTSG
mmetsp:Transcript_15229/g.22458  ORF Transcript_15229/g.22458 Transcript_15229/m.22458 type:complete len:506 (-) Transcript_15229:249-1766(-)